MKNESLVDIIYDEIGHEIPRPMPVLRKRREGKGLILSFAGKGHALRRHSLNRMSMQVYELCDGKREIGEIRNLMLENWGSLPPRITSQHVVRAIRVMQRKGILACP